MGTLLCFIVAKLAPPELWLKSLEGPHVAAVPLGPFPALSLFVKAPFRWRHAMLAEARTHVKQSIDDGTYVPLLKGGLD